MNLLRNPPLLVDSSDRESWTVTLAVPAIIVLTLRFVVGGFTLKAGGIDLAVPPWSGGDYALVIGAWMAFFAQREWRASKSNGGAGGA